MISQSVKSVQSVVFYLDSSDHQFFTPKTKVSEGRAREEYCGCKTTDLTDLTDRNQSVP